MVFTVVLAGALAATAAAPETGFGGLLAPSEGLVGQYHNSAEAVSPSGIPAVSPQNRHSIAHSISASDGVYLQRNRRSEDPVRSSSEIDAGQYHDDESDENRRIMLGLGLGLGLAYLVFLAGWFWATRLRPRPSRQ